MELCIQIHIYHFFSYDLHAPIYAFFFWGGGDMVKPSETVKPMWFSTPAGGNILVFRGWGADKPGICQVWWFEKLGWQVTPGDAN